MTVTVLPPDNGGSVTDDEDLDDNEMVMNDNVSAFVELAGEFEYETVGDLEGYDEVVASLDAEVEIPPSNPPENVLSFGKKDPEIQNETSTSPYLDENSRYQI